MARHFPDDDDWPRCPVCDLPALDGHITCGRFQCDEHGQRRKRADQYAAQPAALNPTEREP